MKKFVLSWVLLVFSIQIMAQTPVFESIKLPKTMSAINTIIVKNNNEVWIGANRGLIKLVDTVQLIYNSETDPTLFKINCLFIDDKDIKWAGTYRSSIIRFVNENDYREISVISKTDNKPQLITSIIAYKELVYFATSEGLIFCYNDNTSEIKEIPSPTTRTIYSFIVDNESGTFWLAGVDGLYYKTVKSKWKLKDNLTIVYGIYPSYGNYWAAGRNTEEKAALLLLFDNGQLMNKKIKVWKEFNLNNLTNSYIKFNDLAITKEEKVWIASEEGLIEYNPMNGFAIIYNTVKFPEMPLNQISHIAIQGNYIWFSSQGTELVRLHFKTTN